MKRLVAVAVLAGVLASGSARAQDAVLSIRSAGEVLDDVQYLAQAVMPADQAGAVVGMIGNIRQQGLPGLDMTKPIGVLASLPPQAGQPPMIVAAIPTTDVGMLLQTLQGFGLQVQPFQGAPGFTHQVTLPDGNTKVYLTSAGGYAYFSMAPMDAEKIQKMTPSVWAPKRPGAGDISLTVKLDKLPPQIRQSVIDSVNQQVAGEQARKPGESDADYEARMTVLKLTQEGITRLLEDTGPVALDLAIDQAKGEVSLAASVTGKTGTPMAKAISEFSRRKSRFAPLGVNAPMGAWVSMPIPTEFQGMMGQMVEEGRKQALEKADDEATKKVANELIDALKPTLTGDSLEMGLAAVKGSNGKALVVGALQVKDAASLDKALRHALASGKGEEDVTVTLDAAKTADGSAIHKVEGPLEENQRKAFGENAALYLTVTKDAVFAVLGENGPETLNHAIAASSKIGAANLPPAAMIMHASKVADLAVEGKQDVKEAARQAFKGPNASKDLVRLSLQGQGSTVFLKLTMDVPALAFIVKSGASAANANVQVPPVNPTQ